MPTHRTAETSPSDSPCTQEQDRHCTFQEGTQSAAWPHHQRLLLSGTQERCPGSCCRSRPSESSLQDRPCMIVYGQS